jgi:hypothetical protein
MVGHIATSETTHGGRGSGVQDSSELGRVTGSACHYVQRDGQRAVQRASRLGSRVLRTAPSYYYPGLQPARFTQESSPRRGRLRRLRGHPRSRRR